MMTSPAYLVELVGTFADSTGAIVGAPFVIGNGPTVLSVPAGASQLQLGINDNYDADNVGSFTATVAGSCPSPTISSLTASPNNLWPPNHAMVAVTLSATTAAGCGGAVTCANLFSF